MNAANTVGVRTWRAFAAVMLLAAAATTWSQEPARPAAEPAAAEKKTDAPAPDAKTPAPAESAATAPGTEQAAAGTSPEGTENGEKAPERFIPTQKSSADNSATFPIDI
jgi:hypothetical protein